MKTQLMTFNISNKFEEWSENFDSYREPQAAAVMTPLFRGPQEDNPQKVCSDQTVVCLNIAWGIIAI